MWPKLMVSLQKQTTEGLFKDLQKKKNCDNASCQLVTFNFN